MINVEAHAAHCQMASTNKNSKNHGLLVVGNEKCRATTQSGISYRVLVQFHARGAPSSEIGTSAKACYYGTPYYDGTPSWSCLFIAGFVGLSVSFKVRVWVLY